MEQIMFQLNKKAIEENLQWHKYLELRIAINTPKEALRIPLIA